MKIIFFTTAIFISSFCYAQKTSFTINKKFGVVIDRLDDFQRLVSVADLVDNTNEVGKYDLDIKIYNEKYGANISDNYLKVDYIKPTTNAIITSVWEVKLEEIAEKKIKVSVALLKVTPSGNTKIIKKVSSGKFENKLKYFLNNHTDLKIKGN
ncbi:hypothetical protein EZJ43_13400 [Pedobacter changchengzhani]|uniref:Uncharacterized protein n=1 Tax=Pedobacter changchengzhani TaxID=2529274 RepID=A0A4R5MJ61_9SPHI|nr:hypothetical protein [Pedobacter changchengzhani]TDG35610.1 hypothetical protein EZJ43_13400 [Pedobacter changchengzhani]